MPTVATILLALAATAQPVPAFDPGQLKGSADLVPNEVLVVATSHLSNFDDGFDPATLEPLIERLAAWAPRIVTIEALSGPQCEMLRIYRARYDDTADQYCWDPAPARAATGLDVPAATAEAATLLTAWPAEPTGAQRRHLAAVFLAAGDQTSALVQWLRLPEGERRVGDGLDEALVARLKVLRTRRNEDDLIAAPLAARLGLERVYPVDDHTADFSPADAEGFGAAMARIWDNPATAAVKARHAAMDAGLGTGEGVLALYRMLNAPDWPRLTYDSDFGAALADTSPERFGRQYLGYWETRNLRMVANIRDALSTQPGSRLLAIVGASHKGYFDAFLGLMHDVRVADAAPVLR